MYLYHILSHINTKDKIISILVVNIISICSQKTELIRKQTTYTSCGNFGDVSRDCGFCLIEG